MQQSAESLISDEIESLNEKRWKLTEQADELRAEIKALDKTVESLCAVLDRLKGKPERNGSTISRAVESARVKYSSPGAGKATDVVRRFLAEHPEGMRPSEIADAVSDQIKTKSGEPRRVVMNTLLNLARRGEAARGDDGRYRPPDYIAAAVESL